MNYKPKGFTTTNHWFNDSANSLESKWIHSMNSHTSALPKNFEVQSSSEDPIVKEVRDARHALAARLDNNLQKIGQDLMSRQQKLGKRIRTS